MLTKTKSTKIRTAATKRLTAPLGRAPDAPGLFAGILRGRAVPHYLRALAATNFGVKLARTAAASLRVVDPCT
jgi:hypothetical protein